MAKHRGKILGINGNMITVAMEGPVMLNEVGYILLPNERLKAEVVRISNGVANLQVFESTKGVRVGDLVEFSGEMLSVQLGPGLLGQIFDGLQNPLPILADEFGFFLPRGVTRPALDKNKKWDFTPTQENGNLVRAGMPLGFVPEGIFQQSIMVPFHLTAEYRIKHIVPAGSYTIHDTIAVLTDDVGREYPVTMTFSWPVKIPINVFREKFVPREPLSTKVRIIDTLIPVAKGGTFCVPGPFGAGKTVLQHIISRYAEVDVVIVAACGERAGEVVELLREFPELTDPRTGRSLMERTIIICNTSSMPVAAREASVYTAAALGEYYRQMGLDVLLLADSTSRWAQAMRELSGRLEEIPGEEAFPAYLESRIAEFYERAGLVELPDGRIGSLTIGGTVSPAGGNFEEPVTQATLKVVGAFLGLSRERANARRYPSIHPLESWSRYESHIPMNLIEQAKMILQKSNEVHQMMMVVGEEGTSLEDFEVYLKGEFLDSVYLQQNAFDDVDAATSQERQKHVFHRLFTILTGTFSFKDKEDCRVFFNKLRQLFIDWNYIPFDNPDFAKQEAAIEAHLQNHLISDYESQEMEARS